MSISSILALVGFIQGLFLLTLVIPKVRKKTPSFFVMLLLSVFLLDLGTYWLHLNRLIIKIPQLVGISETTLFLYGPILFLYLTSILNDEEKLFSKKTLVHFIPAMAIFILISPLFLGYPLYNWLNGLGEKLPESFSTYNLNSILFDHLFWYIHGIFYFLVCLKKLQNFRANHTKNGKPMEESVKKLHFRWIEYLLYGYLAFPLIGFSGFLAGLFIGQPIYLSPILNFFLVFHIFGISYIAFRHQQLLVDPLKMMKYQQSNMDDDTLSLYIKRLTELFEKERPYLKNDLTLKTVSEIIGINPNYISQAINRHYGFGFNDFINSYRVDLAKELIVSPQKSMFTIEAIAEEAGFKSKSTFNNAFKKKLGITPSEYRKKHGQLR